MRRLAARVSVWLFVLGACSREPGLVDEAKKKHAAGDLDGAVALLVAARADAGASGEIAGLATGWLLEAADAATAVDERKRRVEAALEWSPTSGAAQARLCAVLVELGQDTQAQRCLDTGLAGKTGAPEAMVSQARAELAKRRAALTAAERSTLLSSPRPEQWKALVERFPDSPEAEEARQKLARFESLCTEIDRFAAELDAELVRQEGLAAKLVDVRKEASLATRLDRYEAMGRDAGGRAGDMKARAAEVDGHGLKPGEEKARDKLHDAFYLLADAGTDVAEALVRPAAESLESFDENGARTADGWKRALAKARAQIGKDVAAARAACAAPPPAASASASPPR